MCASVRAEVCKHCFVCSLAVGTPFCIALQPVARPEGVTYDKKDGEEIIKLLLARRAETGATLLIITHDAALAQRCERVLTMADGVIVSDTAPQALADA